jgi:heme oxygenase (biliverdin-IX-beta and delta-forming)
LPRDTSGAADVLTTLRTATAESHEQVERTLDLLDPQLDRPRLTAVLTRLHGFWSAAETGLDGWAARRPRDAGRLQWERRRRTPLFAADLAALGAAPEDATGPDLPDVPATDDALGRLYVLEGSTLGGTFIDRHLTGLPSLGEGVRVRAFSPYGGETGAMWHAYRQATREHVAAGGDARRVVAAARETFAALADWCRPAAGEDTGRPAAGEDTGRPAAGDDERLTA